MMNVIGSVWETLDKMHQENPDKYQVTSFISLYPAISNGNICQKGYCQRVDEVSKGAYKQAGAL